MGLAGDDTMKPRLLKFYVSKVGWCMVHVPSRIYGRPQLNELLTQLTICMPRL
jgi:hypothetical protein